jgi:hypothetical protein
MLAKGKLWMPKNRGKGIGREGERGGMGYMNTPTNSFQRRQKKPK